MRPFFCQGLANLYKIYYINNAKQIFSFLQTCDCKKVIQFSDEIILKNVSSGSDKSPRWVLETFCVISKKYCIEENQEICIMDI